MQRQQPAERLAGQGGGPVIEWWFVEGTPGEVGRQPVTEMQHVPGGADVDGVFALPRVAAEEAGQHVERQHGGEGPAGRGQADAGTEAGGKIRHARERGDGLQMKKAALRLPFAEWLKPIRRRTCRAWRRTSG